MALLLGLLAAPSVAQVDDHREIDFPRLPEFEIETPEVYELDNGMRVFLLEDHELPLINVTARIRTGSVYEPADKTGLAGLMGSVQRTGGTAEMTGDEIDDFLEARAASVETSVSTGVGFASMGCLKEDFDDVFAIFHDVLRSPVFAEDKLEIAKVQQTSAIARRNDNVLSITSREFRRLVYGHESPLSRMTEYATLGAVTRSDLAAWHGRYYHPNNVFLGVVGDFDSAAMKAAIESTFGSWPRGSAFDEEPVPYRKEESAGVYFIEKRDVTQANVRVGHLGITYDNPDYFPLEVMNEILGGGFSSRLFKQVRSEKGLAYSVGGSVGAAFLHPGVASFSLQTKSETMGEAVDALREELGKMIAGPVAAEELARAKDGLLNSFIFNYASKGQVLGQQMLFTYYGLPLDFLEKYRQRLEQVTVADVERVARDYLHPDRYTLLVVGNPDDFDRPVSSFGEVTELDITIPRPPSAQVAVARSDAAVAAGRELVDRVIATLGGDGAASTVALRTTSRMDLTGGGQQMSFNRVDTTVYPDRFHTVTVTPMGDQISVITPDGAFAAFGGQVRDLDASRVSERLSDRGRQLDFIVRYRGGDELDAVAGGESEVDGTPCREVQVSMWDTSSTLCVAEDGTVSRQSFDGNHPMTGAPGAFEVHYSDYREVSGRRVAHRREMAIDGTPLLTITIETLEVDPEIASDLFKRPES